MREVYSRMSLILHLETISVCNARCLFCPYPKEKNQARPKGRMPDELYRKIIDEAATIPEIIWINLGGLGEPCLDKGLVERVAYAKKARPEWLIKMYTNGVYMTPDRFDALMAAGLGTVDFSVNAVSAEQHERVMGLKGKYYEVCNNVGHAISKANGTVDVQVKAVVNGDNFTADDQLAFIDQWGLKPSGGYGMTVVEGNWGGENRTVRPLAGKTCMLPFYQIVVQWNGIVNLCCVDALGQYPLGDLRTQTIKEVYNSPEATSFREMHDQGRGDEHPMCRVCTQG
jgi:radical SAM protein with 4Fe4S-binding SPASM domain